MTTKVLIMDDSMMVRQQVKRALVSAGYDVIEAKDGMDALEKADQNADIALVVCDVNMPRMGGLDFLDAFRKDARFTRTPAVMLTTEAEPALVARAKTLDVRGWIVKPFKPELFLAAVRKLASSNAA